VRPDAAELVGVQHLVPYRHVGEAWYADHLVGRDNAGTAVRVAVVADREAAVGMPAQVGGTAPVREDVQPALPMADYSAADAARQRGEGADDRADVGEPRRLVGAPVLAVQHDDDAIVG